MRSPATAGPSVLLAATRHRRFTCTRLATLTQSISDPTGGLQAAVTLAVVSEFGSRRRPANHIHDHASFRPGLRDFRDGTPMTDEARTNGVGKVAINRRLAILLAMAMFVLVVDTSLMNVSISAVVRDLDTTVSGVQSAIALEALVSAAFILIGSKVGDLIGRKRAYVLGLLGYAVGALAMTLAQSLTAIIIFWAVVGGPGRHCCCRPCSR